MSDDADRRDALPDYVRGLLDPAAYPHRPDTVALVQTHISYAFLAGDFVYKTKKPVDFGFIDQRAPEVRHANCDAEVRLNRRLAPDVYLDVVPVVRRPGGRFAVDPPDREGELIEWAVKMRRLPDDRTLAALLAAHREPPDIAERLAERLARFHAEAAAVPNDPTFAGAEGERRWWARELAEAEPFVGTTWRPGDHAAVTEYVARTLEQEAALFDERLAAGRVVEGHGDLHANHVYVLGPREDQLVIVDCIEFNDWFHFRLLDVGYDIAFLAMDMEARGRRDLAEELAGRYIASTFDETMGVLQPLHRLFRAFVRGKVESLGARAPEVSEEQRRALAESASRYFALAAQFATRQAPPALVVICGASGTGKSTVGGALAGQIGAAMVSSDPVRRELAAAGSLSTAMWQRYEAGAYSDEMSHRTYSAMRERARAHLEADRPVILDATHRHQQERTDALALARDMGVPALLVELRLSDDAALARLVNRERRQGTTVHEDAFRRHLAEFEPITHAEGPHLALDAAQPIATLAAEIVDSLPALHAPA